MKKNLLITLVCYLTLTSTLLAQSITTNTIAPTSYCTGEIISIPFSAIGIFNPGNVFTAQLSDPLGSFDFPSEIGTFTSTGGSWEIIDMIPFTIPAGPGYRIRVISSDPYIIGSQNESDLQITNGEIPAFFANGNVLTCTSPALAFQWLFNGASIENANEPIYTATQSGEYSLAALDNNGCVGISLPQTIIVGSTSTSISIESISATTFCAGMSTINVSYTATGTFISGNEFTLQLSDHTGSFVNPTFLAMLVSTESGIMEFSVPSSSIAGTGYRIRVVGNNPLTIGTDNGTSLTITTAVTPTITVNGSVLTSSPAAMYQWILNEESISMAFSQSYTATEDGDYRVLILDDAGCMAISAIQTMPYTPPPVDPCGPNPDYSFSVLKDIVTSPSYGSSSPRCFYKVANNKVFFCAADPATDEESLYFTDGTAAGTVLLRAKLAPTPIGNPVYSSQFCTFQGKMCFVGREYPNPYNQVWISDGTPAGTYALTSFTSNLSISQLTVHNQKLYFKAFFGPDALFESNGTPNSATIIENIVFADRSSLFKTWNNKLYLITKTKVYDYSNNTRDLIYNYSTTHAGCMSGCEIVNGKLFFQSDVNCTGSGAEYRDIYDVDLATGAERSLSSSIIFDNPVDYFREAVVFKNAVYFYYNNHGIANEINDEVYLYKYDGNVLTLLHTHTIDSADISFSGFTTDGNRLLYTISIQSSKFQTKPAGWSVLYETDGTPSGLKKLYDKTGNQYFNEGGGTYSPNRICILGSKVFFYADSLPYGSYPVSRLFYHDGVNAHKILPNAADEDFNTLEMVPLNQSAVLISAYMDARVGLGIGSEPYILTCNSIGPIGFDELQKENRLVVYPNPTNGKIAVESKGETVTKINVLNQLGELILTTTHTGEIDLSAFRSGMYILEVECGSSIERHKVVLMGR